MSLSCKDISYSIGTQLLIKSFNLSIEIGEILMLAGNNGAGKSTLLSLFAGCSSPSKGEVILDSNQLSNWSRSELAMRRAILPQSPSLAFDFPVSEVVKFGALPHSVHVEHIEQCSSEVMEWVDVLHLSDRGYFSLSGGERQRVHLARVLLQIHLVPTVPRYLILDEPLATLDLAHQYELMECLRRLVSSSQKFGVGIILVTHDFNIALRYADRICLIETGSCYVVGSARKVLTCKNIRDVFGVDAEVTQQYVVTQPLVS